MKVKHKSHFQIRAIKIGGTTHYHSASLEKNYTFFNLSALKLLQPVVETQRIFIKGNIFFCDVDHICLEIAF